MSIGHRIWIGFIPLLCGALTQAASLEGTRPLEAKGDLAAQMVAGIDRFLLRASEHSIARRANHWQPNFAATPSYEQSIAPNRAQLRRIVGAVDDRVPFLSPDYIAGPGRNSLVGHAERYEVHRVRWPALSVAGADNSGAGTVDGEGLLLLPKSGAPIADCVVLPDADTTPEMLVGLAVGVEQASQFARRLAESGCRVLVPTLINRDDTYSLVGGVRRTNQPHREFIYRQAYEMGRHLIGYEIQKILAAVDWFTRDSAGGDAHIGVFGYGEGGLLALYAAALDPRIDAVCVSGYFDARQDVWQEPIYRNVWSLLDEFGDAELAALVAPRALVIEAARMPAVTGPPAAKAGLGGAAPGRLATPPLARVEAEFARAQALVERLKPAVAWHLVASGGGEGLPGTNDALARFLSALVPAAKLAPDGTAPKNLASDFDFAARQKRQVEQLVECTQHLMREGEYRRVEFWSKADSNTLETWRTTTAPYRDFLHREVIGRINERRLPLEPRTRQIYDEPAFTGYEVMLDVFPDVFAYGILLVPKGIVPGERRPVVVCQHGLEGRPTDVADPRTDHPAYHRYACQLAEQGFITYAPQNPYIGEDRFRTLQRKANPLKLSLFSFIVPQHEATLDWLASLPMVDAERIAFYGLSYGGKTAMRVPSLVERYCLSICSADFNEWIWKNVSSRSKYSYLGTPEYEMVEFDLGNTFNYAEMAALIAPRPFMVERGHKDGVAPDEWVAYEFAKVRRQYAALKIPERTTIEFFDGPHTIHGVGTFRFLHEQLRWP